MLLILVKQTSEGMNAERIPIVSSPQIRARNVNGQRLKGNLSLYSESLHDPVCEYLTEVLCIPDFLSVLRSETRSRVCTGCFIVKMDWNLYAGHVCDFLSGSICSVQLDAASVKK